MVVVIPAVIGSAAMVVVASRMSWEARTEAVAVVLASQKLEQLRSLEWSADDSAAGGPPQSDSSTDLARDPPGNAGTGLMASPAGALAINVPGFVDFLDGNGRWVGTGAVAPPRTWFIRRWAITPLPVNPSDTLVLQVLVTNVVRDAGLRSLMAPRARYAGEALVATVRTRTSR